MRKFPARIMDFYADTNRVTGAGFERTHSPQFEVSMLFSEEVSSSSESTEFKDFRCTDSFNSKTNNNGSSNNNYKSMQYF